MGEKAAIRPVAEASSEGPAAPIASTSKSSSKGKFMWIIIVLFYIVYVNVNVNPGKKRRMDMMLKNFLTKIGEEREDIKRHRLEQKKDKEKEREERRAEMIKMHNERMQMQKSLIDILSKCLENK